MKKRIPVIVLIVIAAILHVSAQEVTTFHLGDIHRLVDITTPNSLQTTERHDLSGCPEVLPRNARVSKPTRSEVTFKDVTVTEAGTLAALLGSETNDIDSLVVRGPINDEDIHTIWAASFYDGVTIVNLEYATIQGNRLPEDAFWHQSEQYTFGDDYINCIPLRRIILPEGLTEIGEMAFSYAISLKDINFPSTLKRIRKSCFSDCISLQTDPLVFPEGVEEIGTLSFLNCKALRGKVVLPSTIRRIETGAFFQCKISECNFPEGLEKIGDAAFYATRLKEAILPNSCQLLPGDGHFMLDYELEKVRVPEGVTAIPTSFVENCIALKEFEMPNSIEEIGDRAFWQCVVLREMNLSSSLKRIGTEGLYDCKGLRSINFSSSLECLGAESCVCLKNIKEIYCAAPIPPICKESNLNIGWTPFGEYGSSFANETPQDIPVYVPVGSADLYRNAWGWDYFTNFIETDFSGVNECLSDKEDDQKDIYDLFGRKVTNPIPNQIYIVNGKKTIVK